MDAGSCIGCPGLEISGSSGYLGAIFRKSRTSCPTQFGWRSLADTVIGKIFLNADLQLVDNSLAVNVADGEIGQNFYSLLSSSLGWVREYMRQHLHL